MTLDDLKSQAAAVTTAEELMALIRKASVVPAGVGGKPVTILYSGPIRDDVMAWRIAEGININDPNVIVIGRTDAAKFLDYDEFRTGDSTLHDMKNLKEAIP